MDWTEAECRTYPKKIFTPDIFGPDVDKYADEANEKFDDGTIWEAFGDTSTYYDEAREICESCPIIENCLAYALANKERYGMWGGLTPIERRRIERKDRRQRLKIRRAKEQ